MRAIVFNNKLDYCEDKLKPAPAKNEALVKVRLAGVCATDLEITKGYMGFNGIPGHEFSGVVEECAEAALIGKRVTGEINIGCNRCEWCAKGLQNHCPDRAVLGILNKDGAFADYVTLPVTNLHLIPDKISDEEAVFIEPLAAAFEILEQTDVTGKDVCVIGDGRLGLLCAQVLALVNSRLTAVGRHAEKLAILDKLGIKTRVGAQGLQRTFDVVVDCTGAKDGLDTALSVVRPRGTIVLKTTVASKRDTDLNQVVIDEITITGSRCGPFAPAIDALEKGLVKIRPLIEKTFAIKDGVEAIGYAGKKGVLKVLIRM